MKYYLTLLQIDSLQSQTVLEQQIESLPPQTQQQKQQSQSNKPVLSYYLTKKY